MIRGKWLLAAGIAVFLGIGLGALTWYKRPQKTAPEPQKAYVELPSGAEVPLTGQLQPVLLETIDAPITGILQEFPVKPGDEVVEGQILGRIRNDSLEDAEKEANLEFERAQGKVTSLESSVLAARLEASRAEAEAMRARGELSRAERVYQRQSLLIKEGATPRKTYEAADLAYQQAKAEADEIEGALRRIQERLTQLNKDVELARKNLADKQAELDAARLELQAEDLRAPANGFIVSIARQAGDPIEKGFPALITYSPDLTLLQIPLQPDTQVLRRLQPGLPVVIQMPELPGNGLPSTIREIKDATVFVEFTSPSPAVRPGMLATVRVKLP